MCFLGRYVGGRDKANWVLGAAHAQCAVLWGFARIEVGIEGVCGLPAGGILTLAN